MTNSTPSRFAWCAVSTSCTLRPSTAYLPTSWRTARVGKPSCGSWTPSASSAIATSTRSLMISNALPRVIAFRRRATQRPPAGPVGLLPGAAGAVSFAPRLDAEPERLRHLNGVLRPRDRRVHEHRVGADLQRQRRLGRSAETSIDHDRHARVLDEDLDLLQRKG